MFNKGFVPKNPAVFEILGKVRCSRTGHKLQYNTAYSRCVLGK